MFKIFMSQKSANEEDEKARAELLDKAFFYLHYLPGLIPFVSML